MKHLLQIIAFSLIMFKALAQGHNIKGYHVDTKISGFVWLSLHEHNNELYFKANGLTNGESLWKVDHNDNVNIVADVDTRNKVSTTQDYVQQMLSINNILYYVAEDALHGIELWQYDGTKSTLVKDLYPGSGSSKPSSLTHLNGKLYFAANTPNIDTFRNEIFEYDPISGTIKQKTELGKSYPKATIGSMTAYKSRLVFNCTNTLTGTEVFTYDPILNLAWNLADISQGSASSYIIDYTTAHGILYFIARDRHNGTQIFKYDGIRAPKRLTSLDSIGVKPSTSYAVMASCNDEIYFGGKLQTDHYGTLFKYDNVADTVERIHPKGEIFAGKPNFLLAHNNKLYFCTGTETDRKSNVWVYDGKNPPTRITNFTQKNVHIHELTSAGDDIYCYVHSTNTLIDLYKISPWATTVEKITPRASAIIYPNPAKNTAYIQFTLSKPETLQVVLTNMLGQTVYTSEKKLYSSSQHTISVPLNKLPPANYTYNIIDHTGSTKAEGRLIKH